MTGCCCLGVAMFGFGSRGLPLATSSACCRVAKRRSGCIGWERAHVLSFQLKARIAHSRAQGCAFPGYLFVPAFRGCCTSKFICPFLHLDGGRKVLILFLNSCFSLLPLTPFLLLVSLPPLEKWGSKTQAQTGDVTQNLTCFWRALCSPSSHTCWDGEAIYISTHTPPDSSQVTPDVQPQSRHSCPGVKRCSHPLAQQTVSRPSVLGSLSFCLDQSPVPNEEKMTRNNTPERW